MSHFQMLRLVSVSSLVVLALGCRDFQGAYEDCVTRGVCQEEPGGSSPPGEPSGGNTTVVLDKLEAIADGDDQVGITVAVRDGNGDPVPDVGVSITVSGASNQLEAAPRSAADGTSSTRLSSTVAERKTVEVTLEKNGQTISVVARPTVAFNAGPAAKLVFRTQPQDGPFTSQLEPVEIELADKDGNRVTTAPATISLTLLGGASEATLEGTRTQPASSGLAVFDDLRVTAPGTGYALQAIASGLVVAQSELFSRFEPQVDPMLSTLSATPASSVADGVSTVAVTVRVLDIAGAPVSFLPVSLQLTGDATASPENPVILDGSGAGTFALSAKRRGLVTVGASVETGMGPVVLMSTVTVAFLAAPPSLLAEPLPSAVSGCVELPYQLAQLEGLPASLRVEYALSSGGPFLKATQAPSTTHAGVHALPNASDGGTTARAFLWNSTADLPRGLGPVFLRVTPELEGRSGDPVTLSTVQISNGPSTTASVAPIVAGVGSIAWSEDLDRDGLLDLVFPGPTTLKIARGLSDAGFAAPADFGSFVASETTISAATSGDFNGDGLPDVALVLKNDTLNGMFSQPDGGYLIGVSRSLPFSATAHPSQPRMIPRAIDVDRDGRDDLVLARNDLNRADTLAFFPSSGTSFLAGTAVAGTAAPETLAVGDFDRDGHWDLLSVSNKSNNSGLFLQAGRGDGGFGAPSVIPMGLELFEGAFSLGDLDGDGVQDAVLVGRLAGQATVVTAFGAIDGGFHRQSSTPALGFMETIVVVDLDSDGFEDVVEVTSATGRVLWNDGAGTFDPGELLGLSGSTSGAFPIR